MVAGYLIIMATLALGLRLARRTPPRPGARRAGEPGQPLGTEEAGRPASAAAAGRMGAGAGARRPAGAAEAGRPAGTQVSAAGWWRLARHVAGTMVGGYLLLMAVVILYYYLVARVGGAFIKSAFTGCALLLGLVIPVFAAASWLTERRRQRRAATPPPAHPEPR